MSDRRETLLLRPHGGGLQTGMGHVMRSAALGAAWSSRGGRVVMLSSPLTDELQEQLAERGVTWRTLSSEAGTTADAGETRAVAREIGARWVAIDGYVFRRPFLAALHQGGHRLLVIDDHASTSASGAEIVVDPAFQATADDYRVCSPTARLLMGPQYALVRNEFRREREQRKLAGPARVGLERLLVTMGGSDPIDATTRILSALSSLGAPPREVIVVIGGLNPRPDAHFVAHARGLPSLKLVRGVRDMAATMSVCDGAIAAGGTTLHELAALGLPALLVPIVENQQEGVRFVHERGFFHALGPIAELSDDDLAHAIGQWLQRPERNRAMANAVAQLVDARGPERICEAIEHS